MTNFMVTYHAKSMEDMVRFYAEVMSSGAVEATRQEKGCVRYEYFLPVEEMLKMSVNENGQQENFSVNMLLWEQWESREDQAAHCNAPHFKIFGELKTKYGITADFLVQDIAE